MIGIYVFSATGNTFKCADYLREKLAERGETVTLMRVENGTERLNEVPDTLVIGYPIHGFNMPYNMMDFVKGLPRVPKGSRTVYFLKSSGEPLKVNNNSSNAARKRLKRKGYAVKGDFHYVMPYNMIFRHTDELAAKMYLTAKRRIERDARIIAAGETHFIKPTFLSKIFCAVCKIERPGMRFSGRFFRVDPAKCINCGQCVRNCPVGNIRLEDGKFTFGKKCVGCMRCSFRCPTDAFTIGLMNKIRVNGPYDFSADASKAEICSFCHDAYEEYFREED